MTPRPIRAPGRFSLGDLTVPVLAAPMAGGASTPELVTAVGRAGGLGFLATGYATPEHFAAQVAQVRATGVPFGVNVFVPEDGAVSVTQEAELIAYREALRPVGERFGVEPGLPVQDDDFWDAKAYTLMRDPMPVVSFTFGLPPDELVRDLTRDGSFVLATVASVRDAERAVLTGVDALVVQGPEAGGHRATLAVADEPDDTPLLDLLGGVRAAVDVPLVAAGGLTSASAVRAALDAGAVAVQAGTAFLLVEEAGTSPTVRAALRSPDYLETVVTRAFSGRPARGLRNEFADLIGPDAPAVYPAVNAVSAPVRKAAAAAGEAGWTHLWAGENWRDAEPGTAAEILARLWPAGREGGARGSR